MFSTRTTMGKRFVVFALALVAVLLTAGWAAARRPSASARSCARPGRLTTIVA